MTFNFFRTYVDDVVQAGRDRAVAGATALRDYELNDDLSAYQSPVDSAVTNEGNWLETAGKAYEAAEANELASRWMSEAQAECRALRS